jgi:hypothetical protein
MADDDTNSDVLAAKAAVEWWRNAKTKLQWWPLVAGVVMIILHWIIESRYLVQPGVGPPIAKPPLLLDVVFRLTVFATFVLAVFCLPRWQSILAFLSLAFLICSLGGR